MAEDRFEEYFAEKLWEMIPAIYRHEDGLAENPGVLRAVVEIMAEQAARVRRSHDRLWQDQFIELCDDWAVPYIGDLVGTRLVSALNKRARRVDVAKTIYYRRRKGTPAVLEELISDIAGWEGNVVEGFRRLARTRHGLDPEPRYHLGRFTRTPPGGLADLRAAHAAEMSHSAFDEYHHTPDLRRPRGEDGLYGIQRLLFYLHRLRAFEITAVDPADLGGSGGLGFSFDPSGRDVPLFMPRNRPHNAQASGAGDWGKWRQSFEWELPAPMRCRLLGHAEFLVEDRDIIELVEDGVLTEALAGELRELSDVSYATEARLRQAIGELPAAAVLLDATHYPAILEHTIIEQCGKSALYPNAVSVYEDGDLVVKEQVVAGDLSDLQTASVDKRVQIDPERGRLMFIGGTPTSVTVSHHYGFPGTTGAGAWSRPDADRHVADIHHSGGGAITAGGLSSDGVTQIDDSASYGPLGNKASVKNMVFVAANEQRPYIRLGADWRLDSGSNEDSNLLLDGLWIGAGAARNILLRGNYEQVTLRYVTLDPGGARTLDDTSDVLPATSLIVEGYVDQLLVDSCILGPVRISGDGYVEKLVIRDSIVQNLDSASPALELPDCELHLQRASVIGDVEAQCLWASDSLIVGLGQIENTQHGCFRFSAAKNDSSRLPRPYRPVWIESPNLLFTSTRFGDPGYMQLSENAPQNILRGAENGTEMGAYNGLINPIKMDSLRKKVEEYMPFGLLPAYIFNT